MASSSESREREWSNLPAELLDLISKKIAGDIADYARFRFVCKPWRSAAKPENLSPQQLPWLLLPYNPDKASRSFFNLSTRSVHTLDLPETRDRIICGSSGGFLLLLDQTLSFSLFNPLSRSLIRLPPISVAPYGFVKAGDVYVDPSILAGGSGAEITLRGAESYFDCYALISRDPASAAMSGIVAISVYSSQIQYWRPGDEAWSLVNSGLDGTPYQIAFHKGKLYALDYNGSIAICELGSPEKGVMVPSLKLRIGFSYRYLLNLDNELMVVTSLPVVFPLKYFVCDKLEESEGKMSWSPLQGVGDCTVFLTGGPLPGSGKSITAVSCAPGYKKNRMYCVVLRGDAQTEDRQFYGEDVTVEEQDNCWVNSDYSYGGEMHRDLQMSTWITPSLY